MVVIGSAHHKWGGGLELDHNYRLFFIRSRRKIGYQADLGIKLVWKDGMKEKRGKEDRKDGRNEISMERKKGRERE